MSSCGFAQYQVRAVEIPIDSTIALNTRSQQLASEAEKEQLKRLVLQNERRQEQSETSSELLPLFRLTNKTLSGICAIAVFEYDTADPSIVRRCENSYLNQPLMASLKSCHVDIWARRPESILAKTF